MAFPMFGRRLISLIAAYAVALQALLAIVPAPLVAGPGAAALCTVQDDASSPSEPPQHSDLQCCVAAGCHGVPGLAALATISAPARYSDRALLDGRSLPAFAGIAAERLHW